MSLLDKVTEDVVVFPEVVDTDEDGNVWTHASDVGIPTKATIQQLSASGTAARRAEQDNEGFESEQQFRIRFKRGFPLLGAQTVIEWRGQKWHIFGDHNYFNGSRRTRHVDYTIKRS